MRNHRVDNVARDLARLEWAKRRAQKRLAMQQKLIEKRFDRLQERLTQKYGAANIGQQRIIDAALEMLKKDGLNNLSLRKLAGKLDIQAPALYWYFKSKDLLIDYMAESILHKEFSSFKVRREDEDWQSWLTDSLLRLRKAMLAYKDGARVVAGAHIYPAVTLGKFFENVLKSLTSSGIDTLHALHILGAAITYTFGFVIEEQSSPSVEKTDMLGLDSYMTSFPNIVQAMEEVHRKPRDLENEYLIGLRFIIKGSEVCQAEGNSK